MGAELILKKDKWTGMMKQIGAFCMYGNSYLKRTSVLTKYVYPSVTQYPRLNRLSDFHEIPHKGTSLQVTEPLYCENGSSVRHIIYVAQMKFCLLSTFSSL